MRAGLPLEPLAVRPAPRDRIGAYTLLSRLGRGGMGEVWSAVYSGRAGFEKVVALKLVRAPRMTSQTAVMFIDEARATSALSHPSIVRTIDLGREGEWIYIAMELVDGLPLNRLLGQLVDAEEAMSPAVVAHIGLRLAAGLDYAHAFPSDDGRPLQLVHRDVSPHNILVDRTGVVRLTDFGIARTAIQSHVTASGVLRGKPGYFSPEQATGAPLDQKSDVFSASIVLFECATGTRLFQGRDLAAMVARLVTRDAPRVDALRPDFPRSLADVIARGLNRVPDERPTHRELVEALTGLLPSLDGHTTAERDLAALVERFEPAAEEAPRRPMPATNTLAPTTSVGALVTAETTARDDRTPRRMSDWAPPPATRARRGASWLVLALALACAAFAGFAARDVVSWWSPRSSPATAVKSTPQVRPREAPKGARGAARREAAAAAKERTPVVKRAALEPNQPPAALRTERTGRSERTEPTERSVLSVGAERTERSADAERRQRTKRMERTERSAGAERTERSGRSEDADRAERTERTAAAWARLDALTPERASRLRFELTEATASGATTRIDDIVARILDD
ncbi:MAG: protein kinase [Deltaproteobacteria bacterium]